MSPANQAKLDALKAQLPPRPPAADLWDAMAEDERIVTRRQFARASKESARRAIPVCTRQPYGLQSWRAQRAITDMLRPILREARRIADQGEVIAL